MQQKYYKLISRAGVRDAQLWRGRVGASCSLGPGRDERERDRKRVREEEEDREEEQQFALTNFEPIVWLVSRQRVCERV